MSTFAFTEFKYSGDRTGPFRLYIFGPDGYHSGGQWFSRTIRYPDEEIPIPAARQLADQAIAKGREVRVTDGGDNLVFHSVGGRQVYPDQAVNFWAEVEKAGQS
jgi:hypothetical protein